MLDDQVNYIVSGLERSGTSLMMQMLHAAGLPVAYDDSRPADEHNPRGYFELAGGKIINRLMDGTFDFESCKGRIVKVTAYGLKFLPQADYRIVYMVRENDENLRSIQKMGAEIDEQKDRDLFGKLNRLSLDLMRRRGDMTSITVRHRDLMGEPRREMERVSLFLGAQIDIEAAASAVDSSLYRNRSTS